MAVHQRLTVLSKAADELKGLVTDISSDVDQFKRISTQYASQIESDNNRENAKLYLTRWFERLIFFDKARDMLITGKIPKSHKSSRLHREYEHSRTDAEKLYKLSHKEFMSVCSIDGLLDECRQLSTLLGRVSDSKLTRKVGSVVEKLASRAEALEETLKTTKSILCSCCFDLERRLTQMRHPFTKVSVAIRLRGSASEGITYTYMCGRVGQEISVDIQRKELREISLAEARSTTIEDLSGIGASTVAVAGGFGGTACKSVVSSITTSARSEPTIGLGVKSARRVVDLDEEREERELLEERQRRLAADKHGFLGDNKDNTNSVHDIMRECGVNPEALQASRVRAEDEEEHDNPEDLYGDVDDDIYDMFGMTPAPAHATKEELNSSLDCVTAAKGEKYGNTDSSYVVAGATAFDNEAVMAPAFVLKQQQVLLQLSVNCPVLSINIRTSIRNWISHASIANIFSGAEVSDADASVAEGSLGAPQWVVDCDACIVGEVSSAVVTESSTISLELPVYQHFPLKDLGTTSARQLKVYSTVDIVLSSLHKLTVSRYLHDQSRNATTMEVQTKPVQTQVLFFPLSLDQGGKLSRQGEMLALPCHSLKTPLVMKVACVRKPVFLVIMTVFLEAVAAMRKEKISSSATTVADAETITDASSGFGVVGADTDSMSQFVSSLMLCLREYIDFYSSWCSQISVTAGDDKIPGSCKPPFLFIRSCYGASIDCRGRASLLNVYLWLIRVFLFGKRPALGLLTELVATTAANTSYQPFSHFIDRDLRYGVETVQLDQETRRVLAFHCR